MKKHNTIGFNNFKSFGEKIQTFPQKPLTLVYGPNSVGKSSLLHFMLFTEYFKKTGDVNLEETDFAGDPIDLGGFENFVHKKNTDGKIGYHLTLQKESDITDYFSSLYKVVKDFEREGAFADELDISKIRERIQTYRKKKIDSIITYKSMIQCYKFYSSAPFITLLEKRFNDIKDALFRSWKMQNNNDQALPADLSEQKKIFQNCINSSDTLENMLERSDGQQLDVLDKLILFIVDFKGRCSTISIFGLESIQDKTSKAVWDIYRFFHRLKNIKKIKIELEHEFDVVSNKSTYNYRYFIDNELIYTRDPKSKNELHPNNNSNLLTLFKDSGFFIMGPDEKESPASDLLSNAPITFGPLTSYIDLPNVVPDTQFFEFGANYSELLASLDYKVYLQLYNNHNNKHSQYIGPIRHYPTRNDLENKYSKIVDRGLVKPTNPRTGKIILSPSMMDLLANDHMPKFVKKLILGGRLFFGSGILKIILLSTMMQDNFNKLRKHKKKVSFGKSMNSEKMWSLFINSDNCQRNVNNWLSTDSSLSIPYRIETKKVKKKNIFRKLFGLKLVTINKLRFIDTRNNTKVTPREMGLGISQFLPILIATQTLKNFKIFIEQPELHLHPAVQCEIADEIIRSMKTQNNEFFIESHSEHLLLRIMKRMRQTSEGIIEKNDELALTPDDICLLYVDNNGKTTYLNELELSADGSLLDPWPNGFFEEGFKERFA